QRPSSLPEPIRTFQELANFSANANGERSIQLDNDPQSRNSWVVDFNPAVLVATGAQNNVQVVADDGMGTAIYTSMYIAKGDGSPLNASLSLFYEALTISNQVRSNFNINVMHYYT